MERSHTASEKEWLEDLLSKLPSSGRRTKEAIENFFVLLAASTLLGVLLWAGIAWITRKIAGFDLGWSSDYAIPIVLGLIAFSAIYATYSTARWMGSWEDSRQPLRDDLRSGIVTEEHLRLLEAKLLQDPEHGGFVYFLKTDDGRVYVIYDHESIELAMAEEDPTGSGFEPRSQLTIVKAPRSQFTINNSFSGRDIDVYGPAEMTAPPKKWPENEDFSPIPWDQIEKELCS